MTAELGAEAAARAPCRRPAGDGRSSGVRAPGVLLAGVAFCGLAVYVPGSAKADEAGVSFWLPGQYSSLSAVPPSPGVYFGANTYLYSGSGSASRTFPIGVNVVANLKANARIGLFTGLYVPDTTVFGGRLSLALTGIYGRSSATAHVSIGPVTGERAETVWGFGDLYPLMTLSWNRGFNNWMVYLTGDVPVGAYSSTRIANIGIGHGAIDGGASYTYLSPKGQELSVTSGFTGNFENPTINVTSGIDFHADAEASQFLSKQVYLGIVGYAYQQVTGDSGSGVKLGPFKGRVFGAGPELGYLFRVGSHQASLNVRGYFEFGAQNRLHGSAVFITLGLPIWGPTPPAGATPSH
jgi:hypothetical protein